MKNENEELEAMTPDEENSRQEENIQQENIRQLEEQQMEADSEPVFDAIEQIKQFITQIKFNSVLIGGIDREDALTAIQGLSQIFEKEYGLVVEAYQTEKKNAQEAKEFQANAQSVIDKLNEELTACKLALDEERHTAAHCNEEYEKLAKEDEKKRNLIRDYESKQKEILTVAQRLKHENDALKAEKESLTSENSAKVAELTDKISEQEQIIDNLNQKIKELSEKTNVALPESPVQASDGTTDGDMAKGTEIAAEENKVVKPSTMTRNETLEEIYLDASNRRESIINAAIQKAEEISAEATAERERLIAEARAKIDEMTAQAEEEYRIGREKADALMAEAQEKSEKLSAESEEQAKQILDAAQAEADKKINDAAEAYNEKIADCKIEYERLQKAIAETEAENARLVASGRAVYLAERQKFNDKLRELGTIRTRTLKNIYDTVSKLQMLTLEIAGNGTIVDAENLADIQEHEDKDNE